jgi:hypothetical protein
MSQVTYRDGVATIITRTRKTEVHVSVTAAIILEHGSVLGRPSSTDARALAAGFLHLERENEALRAELKTARAGAIGREYAEAMQCARKVIAELRQAGVAFFEVYDQGDAPDSGLDTALRDRLGDADHWLLRDFNAAIERAKVLKGGAA